VKLEVVTSVLMTIPAFCDMTLCRVIQVPVFRRSLLPPSSGYPRRILDYREENGSKLLLPTQRHVLEVTIWPTELFILAFRYGTIY